MEVDCGWAKLCNNRVICKLIHNAEYDGDNEGLKAPISVQIYSVNHWLHIAVLSNMKNVKCWQMDHKPSGLSTAKLAHQACNWGATPGDESNVQTASSNPDCTVYNLSFWQSEQRQTTTWNAFFFFTFIMQWHNMYFWKIRFWSDMQKTKSDIDCNLNVA